jgi:hypothetical protein
VSIFRLQRFVPAKIVNSLSFFDKIKAARLPVDEIELKIEKRGKFRGKGRLRKFNK